MCHLAMHEHHHRLQLVQMRADAKRVMALVCLYNAMEEFIWIGEDFAWGWCNYSVFSYFVLKANDILFQVSIYCINIT